MSSNIFMDSQLRWPIRNHTETYILETMPTGVWYHPHCFIVIDEAPNMNTLPSCQNEIVPRQGVRRDTPSIIGKLPAPFFWTVRWWVIFKNYDTLTVIKL